MSGIAMCLSACAGIAETEYQDFKAMDPKTRLMNIITLTWEVRDDASEYCASVQKKGGNLAAARPIACAVWVATANQCKVVTGPNPNHVVLGHEVRHCFEGHFHR